MLSPELMPGKQELKQGSRSHSLGASHTYLDYPTHSPSKSGVLSAMNQSPHCLSPFEALCPTQSTSLPAGRNPNTSREDGEKVQDHLTLLHPVAVKPGLDGRTEVSRAVFR